MRVVLNWEKCHFMVNEGIVLGHKILERGIEVDRAKIEASKARSTLPPNRFEIPPRFHHRWLVTLGALAPRRLGVRSGSFLACGVLREVCIGLVVAFKTNPEWFEAHPLGVTQKGEYSEFLLGSTLKDWAPLQQRLALPQKSVNFGRTNLRVPLSLVVYPFRPLLVLLSYACQIAIVIVA